jgi:hypothetical protein
MSQIKRSLAEDIDITDPKDTGTYGREDDSPSLDDMYINQLIQTLRALENSYLPEYLPELTEAHTRIMKLQYDAEKAPF